MAQLQLTSIAKGIIPVKIYCQTEILPEIRATRYFPVSDLYEILGAPYPYSKRSQTGVLAAVLAGSPHILSPSLARAKALTDL
jgi:hypothetical protein